MRALATLLGVAAVIAGLFLASFAYSKTGILARVPDASAIQITQVYSEASFYALLAIAAFAFAAVAALGGVAAAISEQTEALRYQWQKKEPGN